MIQAQIDALGDVESLQTKYEISQSDLEAMKAWYDTTKGANESLAKLVEKLEEIQPSVVSINKFTSQSGEVTIEGSSYGKPAVAEFVIQLKALPYISNLKTQYVEESIEDLSASDKFVINLTLQYDDPKEKTVAEGDEETPEEAETEDSTENASDSFEGSSDENVPVVFNDSEESVNEEDSSLNSEDTTGEETPESVEGGVE